MNPVRETFERLPGSLDCPLHIVSPPSTTTVLLGAGPGPPSSVGVTPPTR